MQIKTSSETNEIVFKVKLVGTDPVIWRTLKLSGNMTLNDLHMAIQGAFGWDTSHLHQFILKKGLLFTGNKSSWDGDYDDDTANDSTTYRLDNLISQRIKKFRYEYDFGDSWIHEISVQKVTPIDDPLKWPECLEGEFCGPPEDCGGIYGFENFKEIMSNKKHPEHKEMKEWYGEVFKAEYFSLKDANHRIKSFYR